MFFLPVIVWERNGSPVRWVAGVLGEPLGGVGGAWKAAAHLSEEMEDRFTDSHEIGEA